MGGTGRRSVRWTQAAPGHSENTRTEGCLDFKFVQAASLMPSGCEKEGNARNYGVSQMETPPSRSAPGNGMPCAAPSFSHPQNKGLLAFAQFNPVTPLSGCYHCVPALPAVHFKPGYADDCTLISLLYPFQRGSSISGVHKFCPGVRRSRTNRGFIPEGNALEQVLTAVGLPETGAGARSGIPLPDRERDGGVFIKKTP